MLPAPNRVPVSVQCSSDNRMHPPLISHGTVNGTVRYVFIHSALHTGTCMVSVLVTSGDDKHGLSSAYPPSGKQAPHQKSADQSQQLVSDAASKHCCSINQELMV